MYAAVKSRFLMPFMALLLASACDSTASLQELRSAPAAKSPYHKALSRLYQAYAETEEAAYDWWTSKYFADKGLMVAYGNDVAPEDPAHWNIAPDARADLFAAREKLLGVLSQDTIAQHPNESATAVAAYDCWVEQQDDGWKQDRITLCRGEFEKALAVMLGALTVIYGYSAYLSGYHAGVEWKWWDGPPTCSGAGNPADTDTSNLLNTLDNLTPEQVISCTDAAWRMFGISMAGYNFLISTAICLLLITVIWHSRKDILSR